MTQQHLHFRVRVATRLQNKSLAFVLRNDITRRLDSIEPQKYSALRNTSLRILKQKIFLNISLYSHISTGLYLKQSAVL